MPTAANDHPATTPSRPVRLDANLIAADVDGGRIAENILFFARLLRASGLNVGPDKVLLGTEAVIAAGIRDQRTLYWALHAVFVNRRSEREIFSQAFVMFWRDPGYINQMLSLMVPGLRSGEAPDDKALSRRVSESLFKHADRPAPQDEDRLEIDAEGTFSESEVLQAKDFEQMSAEELVRARAALRRMSLAFEQIRTRRFKSSPRGGRIDLRRILRESAAKGTDHLQLHRKRPATKRPPLVVLCDISGSMESYARVLLHFLHALTNDRDRVFSFLFGTHLSHVTRSLKARDPDIAIARVGHQVTDWSGGTRIGAALEDFNRRWARRVLGQNATVLLITDGLDRDGAHGLDLAARRLRASCRRLVWLNPLMRYERYQPIAAGAEALSRHVSEMRSCHNLKSLSDLADALRGPPADLIARRA
ncbi:MAG: VWA domain-containing protein [Hyphomicrobiaceae bacterium]